MLKIDIQIDRRNERTTRVNDQRSQAFIFFESRNFQLCFSIFIMLLMYCFNQLLTSADSSDSCNANFRSIILFVIIQNCSLLNWTMNEMVN
jgi:hypothetical protein